MATIERNITESPVIFFQGLADLLIILEYHLPVALAINKVITPILFVIGLIGNVTSAVVWLSSNLRMSNTAAYYLASLAIADLAFLILHMFYELEYPWLKGTLDIEGWCQVWNILNMAAGYICVLLVFAFTFERCLSICYPFKSERFSKTSRTKRVIVAIVIISFVLALPQGYFWEAAGSECHVRMFEIMQRSKSFYSIWSWGSEMIMFGILPMFVLVLNVCVLRKLRHAGQLSLGDSSTGSNHKRYISTTVTLLWVSFYLILTTLPVTLLFAMQSTFVLGQPMTLEEMANDPTWRTYFSYQFARTVIKEIGLSHYACNVVIYCFTCKKFRSQLCKLVFGQGAVCTGGGSDDGDYKTVRHNQTLNMEKTHLFPPNRSPNTSICMGSTEVASH